VELEETPVYKNFISRIDIDRSLNSLEYFNSNDMDKVQNFEEFFDDINTSNDTIELNLIKNKAYKEGVIMSLSANSTKKDVTREMIKGEQKTFSGSKLFYINERSDKILVFSVRGSLEGKLNMVINRFNKINEKIGRINTKIKMENSEIYMQRQSMKDKKDLIINMINKNLKV